MSPRILCLAAGLVLLSSPPVWGNGGGYVSGGVVKAGDPIRFEPRLTKGVAILDEQLHIHFGPNSATVRVRYRMRNVTPARLQVRFGFPVEEVGRREFMGKGYLNAPDSAGSEGEKPNRTGALRKIFGGGTKPPPPMAPDPVPSPTFPSYCRHYRVVAGGTALSADFEAEDRGKEDARFRNLGGWLVSEMSFARGEEKEVVISFESLYPRRVDFVSDSSRAGKSTFVYRLSTAACWAGPIAKGRVVLEPAGIDPEELRVIKPVNRFRREGPLWVWEFEELMPTLDDDIEIEAQPEVSVHADEMGGEGLTYHTQRGERWLMSHSNYRIVASSEVVVGSDEGAAANLKKWGRWIAAGPGPGEWLEVKPMVPKPLAAISFQPSCLFLSGGESATAYARPRRIRVDLNGEHAASLEVPDVPEEFRFAIVGYDKPVATLRLTIEEVWPGIEHDQLSLCKLQLHVQLEREPVLKPNR